MDQEMRKLRSDFDDVMLEKERLASENSSIREISEKRKNALEDALSKLQERKSQMEKQNSQMNRMAEELDTVNKRYEDTKAMLSKKDSALQSLSFAHEQLRVQSSEVQKRQEEDKRIMSVALDEANCKCDDQERMLKRKIGETESLKHALSVLEKKCSNAESAVGEKDKILRQLESELESKQNVLNSFSENKTHSEVLKMKLAECERSLARESSMRASAEKALQELKSRGGHLSQVEQEHSSLQEQLRWKKEQFVLLEEAYKKSQKLLKDREAEWQSEKSSMINDMLALQNRLDSHIRQSKDLEMQLQRCNQALAREENRRKVLELQVQESKHGFEKAAAECEEARSAIKNMTENSSKEVGQLRDYLALKDRKLREIDVKLSLLEQENQEQRRLLDEFEADQSGNENARGSLEIFRSKFSAMENAYKECSELLKRKESEWEKEREDMHKSLSEDYQNLASKDAKIHELQNRLDGAMSSLELVTDQKAELTQKLALFESQSQQSLSKLITENLALEADLRRCTEEIGHLNERFHGKEKAFEHVQAELQALQTNFKTISSKCEEAENLEKQYSALENDLKKKQEQLQGLARLHDLLQQQMQQKDKLHSDEIAKIRSSLEEMSSTVSSKKERETKLQNELDRVHELLKKSQSAAASAEKTVEEYQGQLQTLQQDLSMARSSLSQAGTQSKTDKEALLDVIKAKDRQIQELKDQVLHVQNNVNRLSEKEKNLLDLQQKYIELEDQRMQDLDSLRVLREKCEMTLQQLAMLEKDRDILQKSLDSKESDLEAIHMETMVLKTEKVAITQSLNSQEEKYSKLMDEHKASNLSLIDICKKLDIANSELREKEKYIQDLNAKAIQLNATREELSNTKFKMQLTAHLLEEAETSLRERNAAISDYEVEVEQLRNQSLLVKHDLAEKEKDEDILKQKLEVAEKDLSVKEERIKELDANLATTLSKSDEKQAEVERLRDELQEMEETVSSAKLMQLDIESQLKNLEATLKDKETTLDAVRLDIQKEKNISEDLKETVKNLQSELDIEQKLSTDRQSEIYRLSAELERITQSEQMSLKRLKEAEQTLLEAESERESLKAELEESISVLKQELSSARLQIESLEKELNQANEEVKVLSKFRYQVLELEEYSQQLSAELSKVHEDYSAALRQLFDKKNEITCLQEVIKQKEVEERQRECMLAASERSNDINVNALEKKLSAYEGKIRRLENDVSQLTLSVDVSAGVFKEESPKVSNACDLLQEIENFLREIRVETKVTIQEARHNVEEFSSVVKHLEYLKLQLEASNTMDHDTLSSTHQGSMEDKASLQSSTGDNDPKAETANTETDSTDECRQNLENEECKNSKQMEEYKMLQAELNNWLSCMNAEMGKFLCLCNSMVYLEGDILKYKEDLLLNHGQLRAEMSSLKIEVVEKNGFMGYPVLDIENVQKELLTWKDRATMAEGQSKAFQLELKHANMSICSLSEKIQQIEEREKVLLTQLSTKDTDMQHLAAQLTLAQEEISSTKEMLKDFIDNMEASDTNLQSHFNQIQEMLLSQNANYPLEATVNIGFDQSMDEAVSEIAVQAFPNKDTEDINTEIAHTSDKDEEMIKLQSQVENLQSLVQMLKQQNTKLELLAKETSEMDPEKYFHFEELCQSLVREKLRLKSKLEIAERKNQVLVKQVKEMQVTLQSESPMEGETDSISENAIGSQPAGKLSTELHNVHGNTERVPLQLLNK